MKTLVLARGTFVAAALTVVGSALWFGPFGPKRRTMHQPIVLTDAEYTSLQRSGESDEAATWPLPSPLRRDSVWRYEVFTPPEIHFNASTRRLSVWSDQNRETTAAQVGSRAGLELLKVEHIPFRLQLVGYIGGEGNYWGTFENAESSETFLARAGRKLPELGLEIVELSIQRERAKIPDGNSMVETVAMATVRDLSTGRETILRSLERHYTDELRGLWRSVAEPHGEFEAKAGEVIEIDAVRYTVEKLHLDPPSAEVRRDAMGVVTSEHLRTELPAAASPQ